jgi:hypothetical protein
MKKNEKKKKKKKKKPHTFCKRREEAAGAMKANELKPIILKKSKSKTNHKNDAWKNSRPRGQAKNSRFTDFKSSNTNVSKTTKRKDKKSKKKKKLFRFFFFFFPFLTLCSSKKQCFLRWCFCW